MLFSWETLLFQLLELGLTYNDPQNNQVTQSTRNNWSGKEDRPEGIQVRIVVFDGWTSLIVFSRCFSSGLIVFSVIWRSHIEIQKPGVVAARLHGSIFYLWPGLREVFEWSLLTWVQTEEAEPCWSEAIVEASLEVASLSYSSLRWY